MGWTKGELDKFLSAAGEQVEKMITVEQVQSAMGELLTYWKTLPEDGAEAKKVAHVYAKLMMRVKVLTLSEPAKPKVAAAESIMEEISQLGLLSIKLKDIDPIVKAGHAKSLHEVLATIFAVQRQMILVKYEYVLKPEEQKAFETLLDIRIEKKIQARLEGNQGKLYTQAYNSACLKYGIVPVALQMDPQPVEGPVAPALPLPKTTKKKKAASAKVALSGWTDVKLALVQVPTNFPDQELAGRNVGLASTQVMTLMKQYVDGERKKWEADGVECSELLLQHNFFSLLLSEATTIDGKPALFHEDTVLMVEPLGSGFARVLVSGEQFEGVTV